MSYGQDFSSQVMQFQAGKWYKFTDFYTFLLRNALDSHTLEESNLPEIVSIFSKSQRFPSDDIYLCTEYGIWKDILHQDNWILKALKASRNRIDVMDRFTFEAQNSLVWNKTDDSSAST